MDYDVIENIVRLAKSGDKKAKEELIEAFKPFILNLSKKTFISGYDRTDIQNECYKILLKSLLKYDTSLHKFVAYGTNSIKNGIYDLIRKDIKSKDSDNMPYKNLSLNTDILNEKDTSSVDPIVNIDNRLTLTNAINTLEENEKNLIDYIFFKNKSLKEYSQKYNINYYACLRKKKSILSKLSKKLLN